MLVSSVLTHYEGLDYGLFTRIRVELSVIPANYYYIINQHIYGKYLDKFVLWNSIYEGFTR